MLPVVVELQIVALDLLQRRVDGRTADLGRHVDGRIEVVGIGRVRDRAHRQIADRRVVARRAGQAEALDRVVRIVEVGDRVFQLGLVEVDRHAEARQDGRRQHESRR